MVAEASSGLWYQLLVLHQEVVNRSRQLLDGRDAFSQMQVRLPHASHAELSFYQTVTWLYAFYVEAGRVSFRLLVPRLEVYGLDEGMRNSRHFRDIRDLRTYLQHNLTLTSVREVKLQERCARWFVQHCGSAMPGDDEEWQRALFGVLESSYHFLSSINACVRMIEQDSSREVILEQWIVRLERHHDLHEYLKVVEAVIHDLGQPWLDAERIGNSHYGSWSSHIRSLSAGYNFEYEARRLVEQTIMNDYDLPLPITGADIMREFGLAPGRDVGRMLRKARSLYRHTPRGREQLICALRRIESDGRL